MYVYMGNVYVLNAHKMYEVYYLQIYLCMDTEKEINLFYKFTRMYDVFLYVIYRYVFAVYIHPRVLIEIYLLKNYYNQRDSVLDSNVITYDV